MYEIKNNDLEIGEAGNHSNNFENNNERAERISNIEKSLDDDFSMRRDEYELLKSGNRAINQRLEAKADDYRDKNYSESEIKELLPNDKWNYQKEFLEEAFPGQNVSPNVFNGFSENGAKDRIRDVEVSPQLKNNMENL